LDDGGGGDGRGDVIYSGDVGGGGGGGEGNGAPMYRPVYSGVGSSPAAAAAAAMPPPEALYATSTKKKTKRTQRAKQPAEQAEYVTREDMANQAAATATASDLYAMPPDNANAPAAAPTMQGSTVPGRVVTLKSNTTARGAKGNGKGKSKGKGTTGTGTGNKGKGNGNGGKKKKAAAGRSGSAGASSNPAEAEYVDRSTMGQNSVLYAVPDAVTAGGGSAAESLYVTRNDMEEADPNASLYAVAEINDDAGGGGDGAAAAIPQPSTEGDGAWNREGSVFKGFEELLNSDDEIDL